jgi:hypothetical protein
MANRFLRDILIQANEGFAFAIEERTWGQTTVT